MKTIKITPLDTPIDYKKINPKDFSKYIFDEDKILIEPNKDGYITQSIIEHIDLQKKDTTIINAGAGQGKTTAIVEIIVKYSRLDNYKVVIVTPFKSLNNQYVKSINDNDIYFDYQSILEEDWDISKQDENARKPIQVISVKSILRDSGNNDIEQNKLKTQYYDYLIEYCNENNKKVIFVFDEIHESIGSFRKELIPYLFKWKDVIFKTFVVSATFSESTIPIIKLIAHLTDKKIKILEGNRVQKQDLSNLYLYFYNIPTYQVDYPAFNEIFEKVLENKNYSVLNILTYSENLALKIYNSTLGNSLKKKFRYLNICTSKTNSFKSKVSNIGTRFKTGINLTTKNSAFVIILPPLFNSIDNRGLFSDGINSIIQSVARARDSSIDIHVIMPQIDSLIGDSDCLQLNHLNLSRRDFFFLHEQSDLLEIIFKEIKSEISKEENFLLELDHEIQFTIKSFDRYKLESGDQILKSKYDIFGKNLSNYIFWAAYHNQFVNCRLQSIFVRDSLNFKEGELLKQMDNYFSDSEINSESFYLESDKIIFVRMYNFLFQSKIRLFTDKGIQKIITPSTSLLFNHQILRLLQRRKTPYLYKDSDILLDKKISKESIFRILISQSLELAGSDKDYSKDERSLILALNQLSLFGSILEKEYARTDSNNASKKYLPIDKEFNFKVLHRIQIDEIIAILKSNKLIKFLMNLNDLKNDSSIYSLLRKIFFECKESSFQNKKFFLIKKVRKIEYSEYHVNLLYDFKTPEVYFPFDPKRTSYIKITDEDFEYEKKYIKPSDV